LSVKRTCEKGEKKGAVIIHVLQDPGEDRPEVAKYIKNMYQRDE
jgi:hypothetical protein